MKLFLVTLSLITFSIVGFAQISLPLPDTIWLKNGEVAIGEITEDKTNYIKFYEQDDSTKTVKKVPRNYVKRFINNKWASQKFKRNETGQIEYSKVVQVEGVSKNQLFNNAKIWLADTYGDLDAVIELEDREQGLIIVEGYFRALSNGSYGTEISVRVRHSLKIQTKDGRYKYTLYNLIANYPSNQYSSGGTKSFESIFEDEDKLNKADFKLKDSSLIQMLDILVGLNLGMKKAQEEDKW